MGCHFLLQGIYPTQRSNPHLLHCRQSFLLSHQGSPAVRGLLVNACKGDQARKPSSLCPLCMYVALASLGPHLTFGLSEESLRRALGRRRGRHVSAFVGPPEAGSGHVGCHLCQLPGRSLRSWSAGPQTRSRRRLPSFEVLMQSNY